MVAVPRTRRSLNAKYDGLLRRGRVREPLLNKRPTDNKRRDKREAERQELFENLGLKDDTGGGHANKGNTTGLTIPSSRPLFSRDRDTRSGRPRRAQDSLREQRTRPRPSQPSPPPQWLVDIMCPPEEDPTPTPTPSPTPPPAPAASAGMHNASSAHPTRPSSAPYLAFTTADGLPIHIPLAEALPYLTGAHPPAHLPPTHPTGQAQNGYMAHDPGYWARHGRHSQAAGHYMHPAMQGIQLAPVAGPQTRHHPYIRPGPSYGYAYDRALATQDAGRPPYAHHADPNGNASAAFPRQGPFLGSAYPPHALPPPHPPHVAGVSRDGYPQVGHKRDYAPSDSSGSPAITCAPLPGLREQHTPTPGRPVRPAQLRAGPSSRPVVKKQRRDVFVDDNMEPEMGNINAYYQREPRTKTRQDRSVHGGQARNPAGSLHPLSHPHNVYEYRSDSSQDGSYGSDSDWSDVENRAEGNTGASRARAREHPQTVHGHRKELKHRRHNSQAPTAPASSARPASTPAPQAAGARPPTPPHRTPDARPSAVASLINPTPGQKRHETRGQRTVKMLEKAASQLESHTRGLDKPIDVDEDQFSADLSAVRIEDEDDDNEHREEDRLDGHLASSVHDSPPASPPNAESRPIPGARMQRATERAWATLAAMQPVSVGEPMPASTPAPPSPALGPVDAEDEDEEEEHEDAESIGQFSDETPTHLQQHAHLHAHAHHEQFEDPTHLALSDGESTIGDDDGSLELSSQPKKPIIKRVRFDLDDDEDGCGFRIWRDGY